MKCIAAVYYSVLLEANKQEIQVLQCLLIHFICYMAPEEEIILKIKTIFLCMFVLNYAS